MTARDYETVLDVCVSTLMSKIRNHTEDQLQALLQDESRLNSMVDDMPQVASLPNDKELKLAQSKSLAEYNLSTECQLNKAIDKLNATHSNAMKVKETVENMKSELDSVSESRSLNSICTSLKNLAQDADDESERIAENFHKGDLEIEEFVKKFFEMRIIAHTRRIKAEKLAELLRQQYQYQSTSLSSQNSAGGLPSSHHHISALPYPPRTGAAVAPTFALAYPALNQQTHPANPTNYRHSYMS